MGMGVWLCVCVCMCGCDGGCVGGCMCVCVCKCEALTRGLYHHMEVTRGEQFLSLLSPTLEHAPTQSSMNSPADGVPEEISQDNTVSNVPLLFHPQQCNTVSNVPLLFHPQQYEHSAIPSVTFRSCFIPSNMSTVQYRQ